MVWDRSSVGKVSWNIRETGRQMACRGVGSERPQEAAVFESHRCLGGPVLPSQACLPMLSWRDSLIRPCATLLVSVLDLCVTWGRSLLPAFTLLFHPTCEVEGLGHSELIASHLCPLPSSWRGRDTCLQFKSSVTLVLSGPSDAPGEPSTLPS